MTGIKISNIFSLDGDLVMMNPMEENTPQKNASWNCVCGTLFASIWPEWKFWWHPAASHMFKTLQTIDDVFVWYRTVATGAKIFGLQHYILGCLDAGKVLNNPAGRDSWSTPRYITYPTTQWLDVVISFWAVGSKKNPTRYRILICLPSKKLGFTHHPITVTTKMTAFFFGPEIPTETFICHWHVVIGGTPPRKTNMENLFFFN